MIHVRWVNYFENLLFSISCLLLFLLCFENYLVIPSWFLPIGRLHPVFLHFPITLLTLVFLWVLLPTTWTHSQYNNLKTDLLLVAAALAGITVVLGLFLSLEESYEMEAIRWHKYLGVATFYSSVLLYFFIKKRQIKPKVSKILSFTTLSLLVFGSHQGSIITHGEGYLLAGIFDDKNEAIPLNEARVYEDMVMPILEEKCVSCHNTKKAKGKFIMTSYAELLQGGKNGASIEAGHPEMSTMIHRIMLPKSHKEHMPPDGKLQLTQNEISILKTWIKHGASNKLYLRDLDKADSLSILGRTIFTTSEEERYDFKTADPELLQTLNNTFRVIKPISIGSPALKVSFYGKSEYSSEKLQDLIKIKDQIVDLSLHKIPVTDKDILTISLLHNLRKLNLSFTNLSSNSFVDLSQLNKLKQLSLSGVATNKQKISDLIKSMPQLNSLYIWNTGLSEKEINTLQKKYPALKIVGGRKGLNQTLIQLNEPYIDLASTIFKDSLQLKLGHPIQGVDIFFELNTEIPDSTSTRYKPDEYVMYNTQRFTVRAYKKGWLPSDPVTLNVYQNTYKPDSVILLSKLNRVHPASGADTFFDKVLGKNGANNPAWANNWAGFQHNDMEVLFQYNDPVMVSSIALNFLVESETAIFLPEYIEIYGGESQDNLTLIKKIVPSQPQEKKKGFIQLINCNFEPFKGMYFKVVARPLQYLPPWKSKKKRKGLFLVDEIFVN